VGNRKDEEMKADRALEALARANPVPSEAVQGAADSPSAQRILERVAGHRDGGQARRSAPLRGRPWLAPGVAATAVATLAIVLSVVLPQASQLEQALARVAEVARHHEIPLPGPGRFLYVKSVATEPVSGFRRGLTWTALVPTTIERWIAADGSGRVRTVPGRPNFLTPGDKAHWLEAGRPQLIGSPSRRDFPPGHFTDEDLKALPTDAAELFEFISIQAESSDAPPSAQTFAIVGDALRNPLAPPELRVALYQAATQIPGIELLGTMADPIGRKGVGVGITTRASGFLERWIIIFDPATSEVLAELRILLEPRPPTVMKVPVTVQARIETTRLEVESLGDRSS
jgi:hypothetical protein